jgi:hypothetical protein
MLLDPNNFYNKVTSKKREILFKNVEFVKNEI